MTTEHEQELARVRAEMNQTETLLYRETVRRRNAEARANTMEVNAQCLALRIEKVRDRSLALKEEWQERAEKAESDLARYQRADVGERVRELQGSHDAAQSYFVEGCDLTAWFAHSDRQELLLIVRQQQAEIERLNSILQRNIESLERTVFWSMAWKRCAKLKDQELGQSARRWFEQCVQIADMQRCGLSTANCLQEERERNRELTDLLRQYEEAETGPQGRVEAEACPADCRMCANEACNLCGAGCWSGGFRDGSDPARPVCNHDFEERHMDPPPAEHSATAQVSGDSGEPFRPGLPAEALRKVCDRWDDRKGFQWKIPIQLGASGIWSFEEWPNHPARMLRPWRKSWSKVEADASSRLGAEDAKAGRDRKFAVAMIGGGSVVPMPYDQVLACESAYHAGYDEAIEYRDGNLSATIDLVRRTGAFWQREDGLIQRLPLNEAARTFKHRPIDGQNRPIPWSRVGG